MYLFGCLEDIIFLVKVMLQYHVDFKSVLFHLHAADATRKSVTNLFQPYSQKKRKKMNSLTTLKFVCLASPSSVSIYVILGTAMQLVEKYNRHIIDIKLSDPFSDYN